MYVKFSKGEFWLNIMTFFGYVVSSEWIMVDPHKVEFAKKWPRTTTPTDIQSFLGLAGYYKKFVKIFLSVAASLTRLTQKNVTVVQCL